ncbi:MAG: hypothetical protein ABH816_01640 [Candidatus Levyibacteriota bacterium]
MSLFSKHQFLHWAPRILSFLYVLFLSLFALDVFSEYSGWAVVLPLFIHLIPSFILLIVVAISWRYEIVGAVIFFGFALFYIYAVGFDRPWSWYAGISGPAGIVGILFFLSWIGKKKKL